MRDYRQQRYKNNQQNELLKIPPHQWNFTQEIAQDRHRKHPSSRSKNIKRQKPRVLHLANTRHEWRECADDGHELRVDDGLAPVLLVESMCPLQVFLLEQAGIRAIE